MIRIKINKEEKQLISGNNTSVLVPLPYRIKVIKVETKYKYSHSQVYRELHALNSHQQQIQFIG